MTNNKSYYAIICREGVIWGVGEDVDAACEMAREFDYDPRESNEDVFAITQRVYEYVMRNGGEGIALEHVCSLGVYDLADDAGHYYAACLNGAPYGLGNTRFEAKRDAERWAEMRGHHPDDVLADLRVEEITRDLFDRIKEVGLGPIPTERFHAAKTPGGLLDIKHRSDC